MFGLLLLVGTVWTLASPPLTGPDEVEQARRAAAVVRGEVIGRRPPTGPPLVVRVDVPDTYGEASVDHWRCFLGPLVDGSPQTAMPLPPSTCPDLSSSRRTVTVQTVQYRGQPFFYAWVGLGTLWPGPVGTYLLRLLTVVPVAAFLASAAVSVRATGRGRLAGLGLAAATTPMVLYLAGSTNPSGLEIAAALSAWAAGMVLADTRQEPDGRLAARFGLAMVALGLLRGLGPLFVALVVVGVAVVAGWDRCRVLIRRRDLQVWAAATVVSVGASAVWLAHLQADYALPDRPGSGWTTAVGYLPWYLRQSVGVFGTNDSALSPALAFLWVTVAAAALVAGLWRAPARARAVAGLALLGGLAVQVSAEGLSLPPIGFFWQGRYALPLLLGAVVVATSSAPAAGGSEPDDPGGIGLGPAGAATWAAGGVLVVIHVAALLTVLRHYTARGPGLLGVGDALFHGRWTPPVAPVLLLVAFAGALVGYTIALLGVAPSESAERGPVGSALVPGAPTSPSRSRR